ncbi:ATP-binding cassette domain-containing protein [Corynebacterium urealyticum]|uniref:ATP-binding cassette domain-containing protein n=1 Tax=Corynebacterium urealyticum TaxID=43771 RepID=UPI0011E70368|nr:ATP-binding cassette domain-containing protein [Corynebacterium urealyticum]TYR16304.1 ATP-binding cassette domain-containing protein [Corynebacterium urealyticum]
MSIYGVIGPNGAGKTYYLRTLSQNPGTALAQAAPDAALYGATPREYFAIAKTGWSELDINRAESLLDFPATTPMKSLSLGQRQMVITAAALASGQPVLLFDEPFNGLDVEFRHRLRSMFIDAMTDDAAADAAITDGGDVVLPNTAAPERTIVLTSQHSQDLAGLVETLIVIHDHEPHGPFDVEQLRTRHPVLRGLTEQVGQIAADLPVFSRKTLGERTELVLAAPLSASAAEHARTLGVEVSYLDPAELIDLASTSAYIERSAQ